MKVIRPAGFPNGEISEITYDDAAVILAEALRARGARLDDFTPEQRAESLAGTIAVIEAMLVLGWTIEAPR